MKTNRRSHDPQTHEKFLVSMEKIVWLHFLVFQILSHFLTEYSKRILK